jgi:hypothetical protein
MKIRNRAAVITTAVLQIVAPSSAPRPGLRDQLEQLLGDELDDLERQMLADRKIGDDCA